MTLVWLPLVLLASSLLALAVGWLLAAGGVFLRDLEQGTAVAVTMLYFATPIFYPLAAVPDPYRQLLLLNPLTLIVESARDAVVWGRTPALGRARPADARRGGGGAARLCGVHEGQARFRGRVVMAPQAAPVTFLSTVAFEDVLCGRPRRLAEAIAKVGDARVTFAESPGLLTAARRRHRTAPPDATLDRLARVRLPSMPRRAVLAESRVGAARARRIAGELRRSVPGVESGWVIVSDPRLAPVLRHLRPGRLCVDCVDHPRIFAGPRAGGLDPSWHRELVRRADLVSWVNPRIRSFLGEELAGKQTCWIGNGVPASWIRAELGERRRRGQRTVHGRGRLSGRAVRVGGSRADRGDGSQAAGSPVCVVWAHPVGNPRVRPARAAESRSPRCPAASRSATTPPHVRCRTGSVRG